MKYVVIGTGKTGQAVLDILPKQDVTSICNSRNPATPELLEKADVGIVFVPGKSFGDIFSVLMATKTPMVIGTTGCEWPADLDSQLRAKSLTWIIGQNFSLGLNLMRHFSEQIQKALRALRQEFKVGMVETHHIHKLDAPSGTALCLAQALDYPRDKIESVREGDVKGKHTISFDLKHDRILVTHDATDRAAFAEGVILACHQIKQLPPGLHFFEKLTDDRIAKAVKG